MDLELERFEQKYVKNDVTGCWNWTGCKTQSGRRGVGNKFKLPYGLFHAPSTGKRLVMAHRYAYQKYVGPIPEGLHLDHLCRNTLCVSPAHLEPVTPKENVRRGYALKPLVTHCKNGHEYTPENTYSKLRPGGTTTRECRICRKAQLDVHYAKKGRK